MAESRTPRLIENGALKLRVEELDGAVVLYVNGEVDASNAPALDGELREGLLVAERVVLDLTNLAFIDSTGLQCLVAAVRRTEDDPERFGVRRPTGDVTRLFELTGMDRVLPFVD